MLEFYIHSLAGVAFLLGLTVMSHLSLLKSLSNFFYSEDVLGIGFPVPPDPLGLACFECTVTMLRFMTQNLPDQSKIASYTPDYTHLHVVT